MTHPHGSEPAPRPKKRRPKLADIPGVTTADAIQPLWTIASWLRYLVCDRRTIERMRAAGRLPPPDMIVGRRSPRWKFETVQAWMDQQAKGRGVRR